MPMYDEQPLTWIFDREGKLFKQDYPHPTEFCLCDWDVDLKEPRLRYFLTAEEAVTAGYMTVEGRFTVFRVIKE